MLDDLDPDLIRGLPVHICLGHGVGHWARQVIPMPTKEQRKLTKQVTRYDKFFSHDWGTSQWLKFLSLLIHFNCRAAAAATFIGSLICGILAAMGILPVSPWTASLGYGVFFLFLVYWQHIRRFFRFPIIVFFDKLCISQDQEDLKLKSIYGLASFLDRSDELVILWSETYFSRLWCTYEIATFLRDQHSTKKVTVLPVQVAVFFSINFLVWFILQTVTTLISYGQSRQVTMGNFLSLAGTHLSLSLTLKPLFLLLWMFMMKDVAELPKQVQSFEIQNAKCYCCTVQHKHPEGGEIPCDRQLIYGVLEKWYGKGRNSNHDGTERHLHAFNEAARKTLMEHVLPRMKRNTLFAYILGVSGMACSFPWLSILLPRWLKGPGLDCECYTTWVLRDITNWLSLPAALLLQVHVAFYLGKMGVSMEDWLHIFALTKVQTLISILIWLPVPLSIALTDCCSWLPLALIFILIIANVYVYFIAGHSFCTWRVQSNPASANAQTHQVPLPHVPQLQMEQVDVESSTISLDAALDEDTYDRCSTFSI